MPNTEAQNYAVFVGAAVVIAGFAFMMGTQRTATSSTFDPSLSSLFNQFLSSTAERTRLQTESQDRNMQTLIEQNRELQNLIRDLNSNFVKLSDKLQAQSTVVEETRKLVVAVSNSHKELKLMSSELNKHFTTMADRTRQQTELQQRGIKVAADQITEIKSVLSHMNNNLQTMSDEQSKFMQLSSHLTDPGKNQQTLNETAEIVLNKTREFFTEKLVEPIAEYLHWSAVQRESVTMLPVTKNGIDGIALLNNELYVARDGTYGLLEVYSTSTYRMLRHVTIPGSFRITDLTSCPQKNSVYAADDTTNTIYRIDSKGKVSEWLLDEKPGTLAVTKTGNILVIFRDAEKLIEFTPDGLQVREIYLQTGANSLPWHAAELSAGRYAVCHGDNRISIVNTEGRVLQKGSTGFANTYHTLLFPKKGLCPHLTAFNNSIITLDLIGKEVKLLNAGTLEYVATLVHSYQTLRYPYRIILDLPNRKLYVADHRFNDLTRSFDQGTVKIFTIENDIIF